MKKGLVLEGGGMRGMFTAGVLDVFMENDIRFDNVVGVSAGACFGINYPSGQIGRAIRYNVKYCRDERYCSKKNLFKTGNLFNAEFCYHTLPDELDKFDDKAFTESGIPFYAVVTDVESGKAGYHLVKDGSFSEYEWIRASASLPLVSKIVEIDDGKYLDGGMSDAIPLKASEALGCTVNVTILTQPRGYRKEPFKGLFLAKRKYREYPNLINALKNRHIMYNDELDYCFMQEKLGKNYVICPKSPLPIGRICHDPLVLREAYDLGRCEAIEHLPGIIRFIENHKND